MLVAAAVLASPLVVAYLPNWGDLATLAPKIDYARLTHIDLAFENPQDDEGALSYNPANDAVVALAHAKGVKVLVSIGGGGASGDAELLKRTFLLVSPTKRRTFVGKLRDYVKAHDLDGLDIDLEGPAINGDYAPFIADLGRALKADGKLLTAALSQGYGGDRVPTETLKVFDFVNVMAYDATGPWNPKEPGQHSSFAYAKSNVAYWAKRGLPKSKIVLGVPFYGYGFKDGKGTEWSYASILAAYPGAEALDQVGDAIWYNGIPTIKAKGRLIKEEGLAGAMIWSLDADVPGEKSLLSALYGALRP